MRARATYRTKTAFAVVLALMSLASASALALASSFPGWSGMVWAPLPAVPEAQAVAAAERRPPDLAAVEAWSRQTLALRPGEAAAWARLAWVAAERGDPAAANGYLDRSYTVAPFGPDVTAWRLRFAYQRWGQLTPELRRQAEAELRATRRTRWRVVEDAMADIDDPAGRLAFELAKRAADRAAELDRARTS